jgi:hypothetical protein
LRQPADPSIIHYGSLNFISRYVHNARLDATQK